MQTRSKTTLFIALQASCFNKAEQLILNEKANVHQIIDDQSKDSLLHWAARTGNLKAVELLLEYKANVNVKNKDNKTPLDLVFDITLKAYQANKKYTEIIDKYRNIAYLLFQHHDEPPPNQHLMLLFIKQPDINLIELYDDVRKEFKKYTPSDYQLVQDSKKDVVILFFGKYDCTPADSSSFGAIRKYYDTYYEPANEAYEFLSKDFKVFRVLVDNVQQIPECTLVIRESLSPQQKIIHLLLSGHANNKLMKLGDDGTTASHMSGEDWINRFAMKKTFSLLGKEATIGLSGCETALGIDNMTKKISEIAEGRVVFGATYDLSNEKYICFPHKKKSVPLMFFSHKRKNFVMAYKEGEVIANCTWRRAKL